MIHARLDYDRIQDPENKIGENEPVMLFRAQDKFFVPMLREYRAMLHSEGKEDMIKLVDEHIARSKDWQEKNGSKTPDL